MPEEKWCPLAVFLIASVIGDATAGCCVAISRLNDNSMEIMVLLMTWYRLNVTGNQSVKQSTN